MKRSGVFMSEEELAEVRMLKKGVPPAIALTSAEAATGAADRMREKPRKDLYERIDELAREHGLPECQGYYGVDLANGEFLSWEEV